MTLSRLLLLTAAHRGALLSGLTLMLLGSATALAVPWLGGRVASGLFDDGAPPPGLLIAGLAGLLALRTALRIAQERHLTAAGERMLADLKGEVFAHLHALPVAFFRARRRGEVIALVGREVETLAGFVMGPVLALVPMLATVGGAVALMIALDPMLAVPFLAGLPAFFVAAGLAGRRLRPLSAALREAEAATISVAEESFALLPAVRADGRAPAEIARFADRTRTVRDIGIRLGRLEATIAPLLRLAAAAYLLGLVWLGRDRLGAGGMAAGELVAFLLYALLLTGPVSSLAGLWSAFRQARGALENLDAVLGLPPERDDGGCAPARIRGLVTFEDVHFAHPGRPPLLRGVRLAIRPGEVVALTGGNGAGKSTLAEMLLRFHEPSRGRILLDGRDLRDYRLDALRGAVASVPQQPLLFDGSIAENIRFARPGATDDEVAAAAGQAGAATFIEALPQGYATPVGDRGRRLSGGQRQRIALARALLKQAPVVILDEPTAMLDAAGERAFVAAARRALAGRAVLLITHRPASLDLADRVLTLRDGRVFAAPTETPRRARQAVTLRGAA